MVTQRHSFALFMQGTMEKKLYLNVFTK